MVLLVPCRCLVSTPDGDERVSRQEFAKVITAARPESVASVAGLERAVDLFELIDTDHDESISFDEFKAAVVQHPILVSFRHCGSCGMALWCSHALNLRRYSTGGGVHGTLAPYARGSSFVRKLATVEA